MMKPQIASALLLASIALGGSPIVASAASTATNTISILQTTAYPEIPTANDAAPLSGPNAVQIRFVNRGDETATAVEFQVTAVGAPVATIDDIGTFSKDAIVNHKFADVGDTRSTVSVVGVKYADGSEWSANGQLPFVTRRQAAVVAPAVPLDLPSYGN
jgi:hypothetical protein